MNAAPGVLVAVRVGTGVSVGIGVVVGGGVSVGGTVAVGTAVTVKVGVGGPWTVTPAPAVRPMASVTVIEKSPMVLPAVKRNDPPDVGTLDTLTQPPPAKTLNGGLPPVTTNVCAAPLHAVGGAPEPNKSVAWLGAIAGGTGSVVGVGIGVAVDMVVAVGVGMPRNV